MNMYATLRPGHQQQPRQAGEFGMDFMPPPPPMFETEANNKSKPPVAPKPPSGSKSGGKSGKPGEKKRESTV